MSIATWQVRACSKTGSTKPRGASGSCTKRPAGRKPERDDSGAARRSLWAGTESRADCVGRGKDMFRGRVMAAALAAILLAFPAAAQVHPFPTGFRTQE